MWTIRRPVERAVAALRDATREQILVAMLGIPRLLRHPVWHQVDPDQGAGQGVVLVPGFGVGQRSLTLASSWLRARGYVPADAHIGLNIGCTNDLVGRLERRLEQHAEATGRPVVLMGQSRGGGLARLVAIRKPDLVRGLVMMGTPVLDPLGAHPNVVRIARALTRLSAIGLPGLLDGDCFTGPCFRDNSAAMIAPLPTGIPAVAVYSQYDGIVPWRLCLDPYAECVEVGSTHTGMGLDPDVYTALEPRLAAWAATTVSTGALSRAS
jgi:pimeloyl-ACP methyl ester carboxylesterase